jgi:hypothetical protein
MDSAQQDHTVILEALFEGGSLTLLGIHTDNGWRFRLVSYESTFFDLLSEEDREGMEFASKSDWVDSWEVALALLNERWWHMTSPHEVHPDFRQHIWKAAQDRFCRDAVRRKNVEPGYERMCRHHFDQWERVCRGEPPFPVDRMTIDLPPR